MLPEPIFVTMLVIDAFDQLKIPYWIGGSLASALYGTTRSTLDTDLVADLSLEHVGPLVELLESEFFIDAGMVADAIRSHRSFNLIHLRTMFKVDVFVLKPRPYDLEQLLRRKLEILSTEPERQAYVCTPEDIILSKLEWYRMGGEVSDRQWRDIIGVLKTQAGHLDKNYLLKWAEELRVNDLLQRAFDQVK
jgi:hypothetical protein